MAVGGTLDVGGRVAVGGSTFLGGNTRVAGNLAVEGSLMNPEGPVEVDGNLLVNQGAHVVSTRREPA